MLLLERLVFPIALGQFSGDRGARPFQGATAGRLKCHWESPGRLELLTWQGYRELRSHTLRTLRAIDEEVKSPSVPLVFGRQLTMLALIPREK